MGEGDLRGEVVETEGDGDYVERIRREPGGRGGRRGAVFLRSFRRLLFGVSEQMESRSGQRQDLVPQTGVERKNWGKNYNTGEKTGVKT